MNDETPDRRSDWQKRIGVGEPQLRDSIVGDSTRMHTEPVRHEVHGRVAGFQTYHRSGRVDALVTPETQRVSIAGKSKEVIIHDVK